MQSQMQRGHGYTEDQLDAPIERPAAREEHGVVEHDLHDNEKTSVLKKVKAKAKKIKDTIKKRTPGGHDHEHGDHHHHHDYEGHHDYHEEEEEEDDEDEEMEKEPEVHGAPVYDMESAQSFVPGQVGMSVQQGVVKFGGSPTKRGDADQRLKAGEERPFGPVNTPVDVAYPKTRHECTAETVVNQDYHEAGNTNVAGAHHAPVDTALARTHHAAVSPAFAGTRHTPTTATSHAPAIGTSAVTHHAPTTAETHYAPTTATSHAPAIGTSAGTHHAPTTAETHYAPTTATTAATHHAPVAGAPTIETTSGVHHAPVNIGTRPTPITAAFHHAPTTAAPTKTHPETDFSNPNSVLGSNQRGDAAQLRGVLESRPILEEDPHGSGYSKNYQSKVTDPSGGGGEEVGVTPVLQSLDSMKLHSEKQRQTKPTKAHEESLFKPTSGQYPKSRVAGEGNLEYSTGSHDQFSPKPKTPETSSFLQKPEPEQPQFLDTVTTNTEDWQQQHSHDETVAGKQSPSSQQGSYTDKITSTASAIAEKAARAKDLVTSKLGYDSMSPDHTSTAENATGAEDLAASKLGHGSSPDHSSTAAKKATCAKDVMASKFGYGSSTDDGIKTISSPDTQRPPQQGASYTEKLSSVAGTVAEKAGQAKNVVASKLGYGVHPAESEKHTGSDARGGLNTKEAGEVRKYGKETTGESERSDYYTGQDKGYSVKEYLVEKLTPGEDDKALSEVICGPFNKEVHGKEKEDIKGRVTESEEVRRRLGHSSEEKLEKEGVVSGGRNSPGRTMVDEIKGAMTGWFGKGGETQPSKGFHES